jgi:hypothetical protein
MPNVNNSSTPQWRLADFNMPPRYCWALLSCLIALILNSTNSYAAGPATALQPEQLARWDYAKLLSKVQDGDSISDCVIDGKVLSELLIQAGELTGQPEQNRKVRLTYRIQVQNAVIEGPVDTAGCPVSVPVTFSKCTFQGDVKFVRSQFSRGLKVLECSFNGSVDAGNMQTVGDLWIEDSKFLSQTSFRDARIDDNLHWVKVDFCAPVDASRMHIDGDLYWDGVHFLNNCTADCQWIAISGSAQLKNSEFSGFANFYHCSVGRLFYIISSQFNSTRACATFSNSTTVEDILITDAVFNGETSWDYLRARGLYCSGERGSFRGPASFDGLVVNNSVGFHIKFESNLCIREAQISQDLDLTGIVIRRDVGTSTPAAKSQGTDAGLQLTATKITGSLKLAKAFLSGVLGLNRDEIGCLDITNFRFQDLKQGRIELRDVSAKSFETETPGNPSREPLVQFVDSAGFDPQIYLKLEDFLKSAGETDLANTVFLRRNDRFRDERLHGVDWLAQWILGAVAGYGRVPAYSLVPCAVVVLLGCFFFRDGTKMIQNEAKFKHRRYNPIWYSLDVFAPIIDLESAKVWSPRSGEWFKWFWLRAQRILGWLLVPIAVAAFTGFLRS